MAASGRTYREIVYDGAMKRRGQSTIEWSLVVAVLCVAAIAAAYTFLPTFREAMDDARQGMAGVYTSGDLVR